MLNRSNRFVFQIVVHKSLAPKELVKVFEGDKRAVLPAWDPMVCSVSRIYCSCTDVVTGLLGVTSKS